MKKNSINVAIIDYQMSNIFSVKHACNHVGLNSRITHNIHEIIKADAAILPGVGAFPKAMNNIKKLRLVNTIKKFIYSGRPFMGICLGLQLLFTESEEFGKHKGLDIIKGKVMKFNKKGKKIKVPQIGWNKIYYPNKNNKWSKSPLKSIKNNEFMYFVHSYYVDPENKKNILSHTNYSGIIYCSSILKKNVFATQFHPEKSGIQGIKIYQNWAKMINN